jgi:hypothetical protein
MPYPSLPQVKNLNNLQEIASDAFFYISQQIMPL